MPGECVNLYVYPEGSFSKEKLTGLEPLVELRICRNGVVEAGKGNERKSFNLGSCLEALREKAGEGFPVDYDALLGGGFEELVERCRDIEHLELALALYAAPYRLDSSKRVIDALLGGGER